MSSLPRFVVHCPQKNILERIAPLVHAADLDSLLSRNGVEIARLKMVGHHQLDSPAGENRALAAQPADVDRKCLRCANRLELDEVPVRSPLLFDVAESRDA